MSKVTRSPASPHTSNREEKRLRVARPVEASPRRISVAKEGREVRAPGHCGMPLSSPTTARRMTRSLMPAPRSPTSRRAARKRTLAAGCATLSVRAWRRCRDRAQELQPRPGRGSYRSRQEATARALLQNIGPGRKLGLRFYSSGEQAQWFAKWTSDQKLKSTRDGRSCRPVSGV